MIEVRAWTAARLTLGGCSRFNQIPNFPPSLLRLLHAKHRILAVKNVLPPKDQVWGVNIYLLAMEDNTLGNHLEYKFQNSLNISDGEVFQMNVSNPGMANGQWRAGLSATKRKDLR